MEATLGQINAFGFSYAPENWQACNGQVIPINNNEALFSLLNTNYGGDGRTNFGLPNLQGRTCVSQGQYPGSQYDWEMGQFKGQEYHTLSLAEMPTHNHSATFTPSSQISAAALKASTDVATQDTPTEGCYLAHNDGGRNPGVFMYRPDAGASTVSLGGTSGGGNAGSVEIMNTGSSQALSLLQPTLAVNYCIATAGLYPARS